MATHIPVLLRESVGAMNIQPGGVVLDATLGTGGHAREMVRKLQRGVFVGLDADVDALSSARDTLAPMSDTIMFHFIEGNFRNIREITSDFGIGIYDRVFADLGWGSHQIAGGRGFSFMRKEPLNMCYGTKEGACAYTALEAVNSFSKKDLSDIIRVYGEERWASHIATAIVNERKRQLITTTTHLAEVIVRTVPRRFHPRNIHMATKTFQAIRIAVNDEINALKDFLTALVHITRRQSRITVISFHSLEDRVVKQTFRGWEEDNLGNRHLKKAVQATREEIAGNPRARSAKLRTFIFN